MCRLGLLQARSARDFIETTKDSVGIPDSGISLMGVVITGPIKRAVIAGSYTPLYTARVVACSRSEFRSGISDEPVREQVSPLAVVPHNPFFLKEYTH